MSAAGPSRAAAQQGLHESEPGSPYSASSTEDYLGDQPHGGTAATAPPLSWRDPRVGHAHHSRLERTIEAIGMGRYQLHLLLLTGMGWAADNAWMTAIPMVLPAVQDSDTYGRLPSFTYTLAITTLFAIILPFSPSFSFLCFSLFLLGSGLGGSMPTDGTIFLENTPKSKQYLTVALSTFFSAGAALSSAWAIIVMPCRVSTAPGDDAADACKGSWRWRIYLAGLAILTACFFLSRIFLFTLHESPRYLVSQGRTAEARRVLQHIVEYNDTTEREALESIARSAEPAASAIALNTPQSSGLLSRVSHAARVFVVGHTQNGPRPSQLEEHAEAANRATQNGKDADGRNSASSESQDEEYAANGDLEAGASKRFNSSSRPRHLDRGMSVRLSDVRSWASGPKAGGKKRTASIGRHEGIPSAWRSGPSVAERVEEQEADDDVERAFGGGGTRSNGALDDDGARSEWASVESHNVSAISTKAEQHAGEREGLLTGRLSTDHGRVYHDDSVHPDDTYHDDEIRGAAQGAQSCGGGNGHPSTSSASGKPGTIQERIDALLSQQWRKTTLLTWAIWTSLNLGYTMLNVFLPKILEERAGGRQHDAQPPSTQSQSSDAEALWSYFAYALASIPGPLIAAYLVELRWLGRKGTLALSLGCTSLLMLLLSTVLSDSGKAGAPSTSGGQASGGGSDGGMGTTIILVLISFGATTAYAALYGYTPELFAIELRGTACGVASAAGRLAGVMAPMIGGWLLGRTGEGGGAGSSGRSSGPGALCGLSAGLLALTVAFTLALPREDGREEPSPGARRESVTGSATHEEA
ncbi:hypothetical protein OC834_000494 [Tilletia horrida]|nr:hypothetical protein OC834_000494 [Tilletia horrida]